MNNDTTACQWIGPTAEYARLQPTCCRPAVAGRSYCDLHLYRVYQEGTALRKRHKDLRTANTVWDLEQLFQEAVEELEAEGEL